MFAIFFHVSWHVRSTDLCHILVNKISEVMNDREKILTTERRHYYTQARRLVTLAESASLINRLTYLFTYEVTKKNRKQRPTRIL